MSRPDSNSFVDEIVAATRERPAAPVDTVERQTPSTEVQVRRALEDVNPRAVAGYERSLQDIDGVVRVLAGAIASLDAAESKIVRARMELERLRAAGEPIDVVKVVQVVEALAAHVCDIVSDVEANGVNLLKDAKLEVRVSQMDPNAIDQEIGVHLVLLPLDKLASLHKRLGRNPQALVDHVDALARIVHANTNVLSSLMLSMLASRDYTNEVTKYALDLGLLEEKPQPATHALADLRSLNASLQASPAPEAAPRAAARHRLPDHVEGRASLMQLLKIAERQNSRVAE